MCLADSTLTLAQRSPVPPLLSEVMLSEVLGSEVSGSEVSLSGVLLRVLLVV
jgi:hypothetical protein